MSFSAWMSSFIPQAQQVFQWFRGFMTTFFTDFVGKNHLIYLVLVLSALGAAAYFIVELFYRVSYSQGDYSANYKWTRDSAMGLIQYKYNEKKFKDEKKQREADRERSRRAQFYALGFSDDEIEAYDNLVNAATRQRIKDVLNADKPNAKASAQTGNMTDKTRKAVIDGKTRVADLPDDDK